VSVYAYIAKLHDFHVMASKSDAIPTVVVMGVIIIVLCNCVVQCCVMSKLCVYAYKTRYRHIHDIGIYTI
jgi:hypothetical protein